MKIWKRLKSNYLVILLFLLLCIVALMPVFLTEIQNQRLIGKATIEKVKESTIIGQKKTDNMKVIDKLKTIVKAETEITGIVTEQMKLDLDPLYIGNIVKKLNDQVKLMQEAKALPFFPIADDYSLLYFGRRTLMDSKEPTIFVSLWDIELRYENYNIRVYMDTETSVVYQVRITGRTMEFQLDIAQTNFTNFLKYLEVEANQIAWTAGENKWESNYYEQKEQETMVNYFSYLEEGYLDYSIIVE